MANNMGRPPKGVRMPGMKLDKGAAMRLIKYIGRNYAFHIVAVLVCIVISAFCTVQGTLFLETLIDDYIVPLTNQKLAGQAVDFTPMLWAILKMAGIYAVAIVASYTNNRIMVVVAQGTLKNIRDDMFAHMQTLPIKFFDTHTHGDVMSHYTNDTDTLRQMIAQSLPQLINSSITIVTVFISMCLTNWLLTLLVMCTISSMMVVSRKIAGRSGRYFLGQQVSLGKVNGYIEEMIKGQKVVKVFCHEEEAKADFDKLNDELAENAYKANKFANILMPILGNLGHLQYVIVAIAGGFIALYGGNVVTLTLGGLVTFLTLTKNFTMPVNQVSNQINAVIMALAGASRIFALMDEASEEDNGYVTLVNAKYDENGNITESEKRTGMWAWKHPHETGELTYTLLEGDVRMFEVDFSYDGKKTVLTDVSLYAKPGQKVAFVGATGAGKTTITNLINRFYDIADGKIRYDGININKIRKTDLRRSMGIVLQDTNLFTGTVMENIRYGKLDATDEEVYAAAKLANADDFISRLPDGYDTMLTGNGSQLSQGQRQLISIARAAIADPPVMILDEATSSIDTRTEAIVQRGMDQLMKGRTVFVIAHRLSTVKNSDVIMVLDHGKIIERGSHDELIAQKGNYYRLYTGAFELE